MRGKYFSADGNGGWKNHHDRMKRWSERVLPLCIERQGSPVNGQAVVDFALAFFLWAHSLREWLIEDGASLKDDLDRALASETLWSTCRDLANRTRHFELRQRPVDKDWTVFREYDPYFELIEGVGTSHWWLEHDGKKSRLDQLVVETVAMWSLVLKELGLDPSRRKADAGEAGAA